MIEAGNFVVRYLVNSVWQVPLLLAAGLLVSRILRKLGCVVQHRVWTAALIIAAIVPFVEFRRSAASVHLLMKSGPVNVLADPHTMHVGASVAPGIVRLAPPLYFTILFAYLTFLVVAALRLGWGLYKTRQLVSHSTAISLPQEVAEIWQRCKNVFAIPSTMLASSSEITAPVTIGTRSAVLLIPPGFLAGSTEEDLTAALAHECAHLERRDFFLNLLYQLISLPIAYHPATWAMKSRIAETRELICDRMAAERIAGSRSYARSLLRLAAAMHAGETSTPDHAIGMFDASTLENRIGNLMSPQPSVSRGRRIVLLALGILLLSVSGIAAVALTANVEELANVGKQVNLSPQQALMGGAEQHTATPIQSPSQNSPNTATNQPPKIYHVGNGVSAPKLVFAPDPEYPQSEKKQGVVVVDLIVDTKGLPQHVRVVRSFRPALDKSAVRAVEQYRFTPAMLQGKPAPTPVAVEVNIEVNFNFKRY